MRRLIFIAMVGIFMGLVIGHAQTLSNQQVIDLQGQLQDDQRALEQEQAAVQFDNSDMNRRMNEIAGLNQRIADAEAVLEQVDNAQSNAIDNSVDNSVDNTVDNSTNNSSNNSEDNSVNGM